jgi:acid phosphatase
MMTTGQIVTNNDGYTGTVTTDNVVRRLIAGGKTWKSYAQSIPSVGYVGPDVYPYAQRHNPLSYFSDVRNEQRQLANLTPLSQLATDLQAGTLPNYAFIVPDLNHDAHDCPVGMTSCTLDERLAAADEFLAGTIGALERNREFLATGVVVVVFDEAADSDTTHGGGHVAAVLAGPRIKAGYESAAPYQHQNLERFTLESLGLTSFPGAGATAETMAEFLKPAVRMRETHGRLPQPE